ncbi:MAG: hypothetical protein WD578_07275 [Bacteroidales bacterium]
MNRHFLIYILLGALLIPSTAEAQRWKLRRYEAGIGIGTVTSFTDIGSPDFGLTTFFDTRFNACSHLGFLILEDLSVKLDLNYLMIGASDPETRDRALSFTSHGFEHAVRVDYTFLGGGRTFSSATFNRRGMVNNFGTAYLYVFAGAGGILTKATVKDANGEEDIGNIGYSNNMHWGAVIPAGIGFRVSIDAYFDLVLEVGGRYTFTDWIDGYKTEFSQYDDRYIITSVKAAYKIRNDRRGRPFLFIKHDRW